MFVNGALCKLFKLMISVQTGNHEKKKNSKKSDSQRQQFCIFYVRIPRGRNRGIFQ